MLCEHGEASLDQVTQRTGYPKASVLRMLQTLCDLQLVERNVRTGLYCAVARIAYSGGSRPDFGAQVQQTLERLSEKLQVTAEWFEPGEDGLLLSRRASPPDAEVRVKARAGFIREWNGELDAVAVIGYAFYSAAPGIRRGLWTYDPQGGQDKLTMAAARALIEKAVKTGWAIDVFYNSQGVKRVAAPVVCDGELAGVLSLACPFTPTLEPGLPGKADTLRVAADELQRF